MLPVLRRSPGNRGFVVRWTFVLATLALAALLRSPPAARAEAGRFRAQDDDFAEFDFDDDEFESVAGDGRAAPADADAGRADPDEFEDEEGPATTDERAGRRRPASADEEGEDEAVVETEEDEEEDEFAHFADEEEFEGFGGEEGDPRAGHKRSSSRPPPPKTINIAKVPAHLHNNWENYLLEILMTAGLVVYFLNFFTGKSKNHRLATSWFDTHKALLETNFALVGDDGSKNLEDVETQLVKESEHAFVLWCSGRVACDSMLVEIKLLKRQDLVSVIANIMKPANDQVHIRVNMNPEDMDSFVFCVAQKKTASRLAREMSDLNTFCPEKRSVEKYGVPANFVAMSEVAEVTAAMFDSKLTAILNKYPEAVDSIHFSDQFTGPKPADDQAPSELPEGKKVLIFTFNMVLKQGVSMEDCVEDMRPLMLLVFYFMDKVKRYRLSREAKHKAEKNRSKVTEAFWKSIHAARAEKAQEERERKRREMKERIREIEDPERQRKMEDRENRRDKKKNQPKMKQLKVKAM